MKMMSKMKISMVLVMVLGGCAANKGGTIINPAEPKIGKMPDGKVVAHLEMVDGCGAASIWQSEYVTREAANGKTTYTQVGGERAVMPSTCQQQAVTATSALAATATQGVTAIATSIIKADAQVDAAREVAKGGSRTTYNISNGSYSGGSAAVADAVANSNSDARIHTSEPSCRDCTPGFGRLH